MERKRKLEVYDGVPQANGGGGAYQNTAAPPAGDPHANINPYTGRSYSARYHQILSTRQGGWAAALVLAHVCGSVKLGRCLCLLFAVTSRGICLPPPCPAPPLLGIHPHHPLPQACLCGKPRPISSTW